MQPHILIFYLLMFFVAFLYASVGHGGGSGYLALMAMFGVAPFIMHSTALTLDLFVSITSFTLFYKGKHFDLKMFLPLAIASVPMAFLGGLMSIDGSIYKKILGVLLLIIVVRFIFFRKIEITKTKKASVSGSVLLGALIGFASG
ncbi:sulfite exporter TauE/SafE family protein, partial [Arachidicoccus sp.]|uniref:sulfite exporter TauE/SafE family protein n=1 Tax=Arachidicoccus sp. TaxID=1872624 RepID=UPI003D23FBF9